MSTDTSLEEHASSEAQKSARRNMVEWIVLIVAAVLVAFLIKTFLFQPFSIPSASMVPTLEVGDRVLVNKLSYDFHDIERGDIVVFTAAPNGRWRSTGDDDLVKRVIGLPGETITECETGRVCINGRLLHEGYLPAGTTTTINDIPPGCAPDSPPHGCTVPAGKYFVMGDNRSESADARYYGPIKGSSVVGRAFLRMWPLNRIGTL
ncbi:MAG TPA: signal peptidase I [Acidimicrobiia bacterium]|nr:signal peptidase I [Acidimicrobiia bacterium]